jgi:hypothetical protein
MENGVEKRGISSHQHGSGPNGNSPGSPAKPDLYRALVADSDKLDKRNIRDMNLEWITDVKTGAETAYGIGGFQYRIYTTEEFGTCCMYMWPGHFVTAYYDSHDEGKQAMNDHYEALCHVRDESVREMVRENEALKKKLQQQQRA